jgi:hypothetical protein
VWSTRIGRIIPGSIWILFLQAHRETDHLLAVSGVHIRHTHTNTHTHTHTHTRVNTHTHDSSPCLLMYLLEFTTNSSSNLLHTHTQMESNWFTSLTSTNQTSWNFHQHETQRHYLSPIFWSWKIVNRIFFHGRCNDSPMGGGVWVLLDAAFW